MSTNNKTKKSKKKIIVFSSIGIIVLALILLVIFKGSKDEIISVTVEKVKKRDLVQTVTATGTISSEFQVIITPEVTGEIVALNVKEGDKVTKGLVLFRIKSDTYAAALERAEASLLSSRASLNISKAEREKVTADYNRMMELYDKKLISDSEMESIKSSYLTAQARYESSQALVKQNEAAVREAREQLNKTVILSPMDGTITKLNVEVGERVLGSGFTQGTNVMTVSDLNNMQATVDVDENDIPTVKLGDTARVKIDAFGTRTFRGIVTEIGNSAKSSGFGTQEQVVNFEVKIKLIEHNPKLRPGMSCNSIIETERVYGVLSVPIQSVTARSDVQEEEIEGLQVKNGKEKDKEQKIQEIVFLAKDSKSVVRNVETGISDDNYIEVKSGLSEDDEVISGSYKAISRDLKNNSVIIIEKTR